MRACALNVVDTHRHIIHTSEQVARNWWCLVAIYTSCPTDGSKFYPESMYEECVKTGRSHSATTGYVCLYAAKAETWARFGCVRVIIGCQSRGNVPLMIPLAEPGLAVAGSVVVVWWWFVCCIRCSRTDCITLPIVACVSACSSGVVL